MEKQLDNKLNEAYGSMMRDLAYEKDEYINKHPNYFIYETDDCNEFDTLKDAIAYAEKCDDCETITRVQIGYEEDGPEYYDEIVWTKETNKLNEATSNFGRLEYLPLLVFYTCDEVIDKMKNDPDYPNYEDFDTDREYYDAREEFEQKFLENFEDAVLDESDIDSLENDLYLFNQETKDMAFDADEPDLEDIVLEIIPGYYEANCIDCEHEYYFRNLDKEVREEQLERFTNFLNDLKSKYNLTQLGVTGTLSNGETIYHKVESLKEDEEKKDSIYYCLSDKKMPKHSILLYGEEGRDKLLEIAPKYLEYYGQAEIFKSVNGHKTTIWEDGKLIEEEPTIKIKPDSEKVVIDKEDTSEVGEPGNPVQQGLKGVSKLEELEEGASYRGLAYYEYPKGSKCYIRETPEVFVALDETGKNIGQSKTKAGAESYIDKYLKNKVKKDESLKEAFNGEEVFVHVFDIDYYVTEEDVDNESEIEEIKAKLPQDLYFSFEEYFEDDSELEERIADAISDETGWLVETFDYELLSEEEYNHYSQLKEAKKKKEKVRFVGNPEKEMAFFNHAMGSDASAASTGVALGESEEVEYVGNAKIIKSVEELPKVGEPYGHKDYFVIKVNKKKDKNGRTIYDVISQEKDARGRKLGNNVDVAHYSFVVEESLKESKLEDLTDKYLEQILTGAVDDIEDLKRQGYTDKQLRDLARQYAQEELEEVGEEPVEDEDNERYSLEWKSFGKIRQAKYNDLDKAKQHLEKLKKLPNIEYYDLWDLKTNKIIESVEESLKESRDDERVVHYQELLDELYVTPEETELILKTADDYETNAQRGWISFEEANKVTEKLGLKHLSQLDLSRMWEIVYYTLEKAAFENNGENYEKYSDAASAFAEVINMEARRRKEHTNSDANLEGIVGDKFAIDNDGLLYLYTSAMKDLIAWAKRRGKSIDELLNMSLTKSKDGRTATLNLKDYSMEFKRLWDQVREEVEGE